MSFVDHFSHIEDPRKPINLKYDFLDMLFLTVAGVVSGAEGWSDIVDFGYNKLDWLQQYRDFEHGIPVDDTLARIIRAIEPAQLNQAFINWVNEERRETGKEQIAIDGKTLRGSRDAEQHSALHSITAWSKSEGLVLAQLKSSAKKNENASVLEVLNVLNVKGATVTVDAMNTQKKIAERIIDKKADYVMCVKDNQKTLREEIAAYFHKVERDTSEHLKIDEEVDKGHGRVEVRRCSALRVNEWISEADKWKGIQSIVKVERERHLLSTGKVQTETQYYISSLTASPKELAEAIRGHWEVENKVHWVLDVTFKEDD